MKYSTLFLVALLPLAGLVACNRDKPTEPASPAAAPAVIEQPAETPAVMDAAPMESLEPSATLASASAALKPASGSQVTGTVNFTESTEGLRLVADISGLGAGKHGFHVHEKGDCSDPAAKSAGDHFNPGAQPHGAPDASARHAGDLGNITADDKGHATLDTTLQGVSLSGPNGLVGRGLIVHAQEDDLSSQPSGNAGARVACAVIEAAG